MEIFKLFGINNIYFYEDFFKTISFRKARIEADQYIQSATETGVLKLTQDGTQVGKYAAASFMRRMRASSLNLEDDTTKSLMIEQLAHSLRAATAIEMILRNIEPTLVFVIDRGYTPVGQLFDACLLKGIPVISRNSSHKSGNEILKRYSSSDMGVIHPQSLSVKSWEYIKKMPWSEGSWQELYNELEKTYKNGDWFSEVGTQFNKIVYSKKELISKLEIDSRKKTAIIFPHIFWDATFFWGEDLFKDYHDWFVNVLRVAAKNKNLNWIIKIHPANVVKARRDNYLGKHKELLTVHETLGSIPEHIKIINPEDDINTFSLFGIMDYCLTVRGTIGIETSAMGINTITAGTGRYDRHGFTYDFVSKNDYLHFINSLNDLPAMDEAKINLARRFAYGIFILRPIHIDILEYRFNQDARATMVFRPIIGKREEFEHSRFVQGFRGFVMSGNEDYLNLEGNF